MKEKVDRLCTHAARLENIEEDVSTISKAVTGVTEKTDVISSSVSSLNERVDDIKFVFEHKATRSMQSRRLELPFWGNDLEIIRWRISSTPSNRGWARC